MNCWHEISDGSQSHAAPSCPLGLLLGVVILPTPALQKNDAVVEIWGDSILIVIVIHLS